MNNNLILTCVEIYLNVFVLGTIYVNPKMLYLNAVLSFDLHS